MSWLNTIHRCAIPTLVDIQRQKANHGSTWECPDCLVVWTLNISSNQLGSWVNNSTGLIRKLGVAV